MRFEDAAELSQQMASEREHRVRGRAADPDTAAAPAATRVFDLTPPFVGRILDAGRRLEAGRRLLGAAPPRSPGPRGVLVVAVSPGGWVPRPRVGLGVSPHPQRAAEWRVAVRAWYERDLHQPEVASVLARVPARERDVRITGPITARGATGAGPYRGRCRPLRAGYSVGHRDITAGTLGAFVYAEHGDLCMLSNNHVLANANMGQRGDPIYQQGPSDGGTERDEAGKLLAFQPLGARGNKVDAALADIRDDARPADLSLPEIGPLAGTQTALETGPVQKVGRTTGRTFGAVTAVNLRGVPVDYDGTVYRFDRVLEVTGTAATPVFSRGGDSGALVVNADRFAVGLLFAGDEAVTYVNPIDEVLGTLNAKMAL